MPCKKCGSDAINTKHINDGELINSSSLECINDEFLRSIEYEIYYQVKASKEHLAKKCKECGFGWRQNVIN